MEAAIVLQVTGYKPSSIRRTLWAIGTRLPICPIEVVLSEPVADAILFRSILKFAPQISPTVTHVFVQEGDTIPIGDVYDHMLAESVDECCVEAATYRIPSEALEWLDKFGFNLDERVIAEARKHPVVGTTKRGIRLMSRQCFESITDAISVVQSEGEALCQEERS